jgi:hypothetical protein
LVAGTGIGEYDNVIWGDYYYVNYGENFAQGDTLVHVEAADPADLLGQDTLNGTFWGRCSLDGFPTFPDFVEPWPDLRETLPTTFATRFFQNDAFDGGTDLLVWRDSVVQFLIPDLIAFYYGSNYGDNATRGFNCNIGPLWAPLTQRQVVVFDEQENPEALCTVSPCPEEEILFPWEAQRVSIPSLEAVPQSGWIYMNLNQEGWFFDDGAASSQAWVTAVHSAEGRFSAGLPAIQLDNYCDNTSILIGPSGPDFPTPELSYNYFTSYYYYGGIPVPPRAESSDRELPNRLKKKIN